MRQRIGIIDIRGRKLTWVVILMIDMNGKMLNNFLIYIVKNVVLVQELQGYISEGKLIEICS